MENANYIIKTLFNSLLIGLGFVASFLLALTIMSFDEEKVEPMASNTFYEYTYPKDTIANAANDTLYLPSNMRPVLSNYQITYAVTRTNISGTTNLAVKIEESAYRYSGSTPPTAGWAASLNSAGSAAATAATTATTEALYIPNAYGCSYRCIIDGTGTQSSSYVIRVILKKKS